MRATMSTAPVYRKFCTGPWLLRLCGWRCMWRGRTGDESTPRRHSVWHPLRIENQCEEPLRIANQVKNLTPGAECALYVDDFCITLQSSALRTADWQLLQCLNRLQAWADSVGFKLSRTKTVYIHFFNRRYPFRGPTLMIDSSQIPVNGEVKFLGMIFHKKLSFKPYIVNLKKKWGRALRS